MRRKQTGADEPLFICPTMRQLTVNLRDPHPKQIEFIDSPAKRKVVRAGRRSGKTTGVAIHAVEQFLRGRRILYATPTQEQVDRFWHEVKRALDEPISAGLYYKNETTHIIELPGTEQRIRAKTAWNADSLRGDYADVLILDEYQDMDEDAWSLVGAPMLLDNNGDAIFIYTKKRGKSHSDELFKKAKEDTTARWATFVFSSFDNPSVSREALADITNDMTDLAYRMEIMAEDIEDDPGALWSRAVLEATRVTRPPELHRIVVAVDPPGSTGQCGIVVAGAATIENLKHGYTLEDCSPPPGSKPEVWAMAAVAAYHKWKADAIVAEVNYGGDMVESAIKSVRDGEHVNFKSVRATRGKQVRAEPVSALFARGRGHHVGAFRELEDELCNWVQGNPSPNRLDAEVWAYTDLILGGYMGSMADVPQDDRGAVSTWDIMSDRREREREPGGVSRWQL